MHDTTGAPVKTTIVDEVGGPGRLRVTVEVDATAAQAERIIAKVGKALGMNMSDGPDIRERIANLVMDAFGSSGKPIVQTFLTDMYTAAKDRIAARTSRRAGGTPTPAK